MLGSVLLLSFPTVLHFNVVESLIRSLKGHLYLRREIARNEFLAVLPASESGKGLIILLAIRYFFNGDPWSSEVIGSLGGLTS